MGKRFAIRLALIAFVVVILRNLIAGNDFFESTKMALIGLALFFVFGYFLGNLARQVIEEHVETETTILLNNLTQANQESA